MTICATEIQQRWPASSTTRMDMLVELERRGMLKSKMAEHMGHGMEGVWSTHEG